MSLLLACADMLYFEHTFYFTPVETCVWMGVRAGLRFIIEYDDGG